MLKCIYLGCEGQMTPMRISPVFVRVLVTASEAEAAQENKVGPLKQTVLCQQCFMI